MNKHIKIFAFIIGAVMAIACLSAVNTFAASSGTCGDSLTYTLDDDGTLTISGTGDMINYTAATYSSIPWYSEVTNITSVVIEDGVTSIGNIAFYKCTSLNSITIPDGVTSIGSDSFSYCTSLSSITVPNSVTSIGDKAFYKCTNLSGITIPESVTSIEDYLFYNCTNLSDIIIPERVTSIGGYAFCGCTSLSSIIIPEEVISIGACAFRRCTSLSNIIIPEGITSIDRCVFYNCTNLSSVTIPEGVTSIGDYAFYKCTSLNTIILLDSVTSIGDSAFSSSGLTSVYCYEGSVADDLSLYPKGVTIIYLDGSSDDSDLEFTDLTDAIRILRYAEGSVSLTEAELAAADINGDEAVDKKDAALVLKQIIYEES